LSTCYMQNDITHEIEMLPTGRHTEIRASKEW
jgi:hypothetical protein